MELLSVFTSTYTWAVDGSGVGGGDGEVDTIMISAI